VGVLTHHVPKGYGSVVNPKTSPPHIVDQLDGLPINVVVGKVSDLC